MSKDDCVAVLGSKVYPDATEDQEWRIVWASAIENAFLNDKQTLHFFGRSAIYDSLKEALDAAQRLDDKHRTELGVIRVRHPKDRTWDEMVAGKPYQKRKVRRK